MPEFFERDDERTVREQLHGVYRVVQHNCGWKGDPPCQTKFDHVQDTEGNVSMAPRVSDLISWLMDNCDPDMAVTMDDGTPGGPENGPNPIFEIITLYDDPDPYEAVVIRPVPQRRR